MYGQNPMCTLHDDATLVCVAALRVGGFTLVHTLFIEGEIWQDQSGTLGTGAGLGRHQTVHLPPSQFRDRAVKRKAEGEERKEAEAVSDTEQDSDDVVKV